MTIPGHTAPIGLYERNKARPFLGSTRCTRRGLVAGEWTELELVYDVGASGLADGAGIKLAMKFYSDWALFQTSDPTAANYVSAEYEAGPLVPGQSPATVQALKVRFDQKGHERPYQKAIIIDVIDGYLNPGDRIAIRLGDRRQGGPGTRVQTFVEQGFRFRVFIDPLGSQKYAEVPGDCVLDIVPGAPAALRLVAPRLIAPGRAEVVLRADDAWGNCCTDTSIDATLTLTGPTGTTERAITLSPDPQANGWTVRREAFDLTPGEWRVEATAPGLAAADAFVTVEDGVPRTLYADLHVHSNDTVGTNDTAYNLSYGRDVAGLDVLGYTANDFNVTERAWTEAVALIDRFNEPERFVCYPGTEWCGNSAAGGDHNVIFLRDGQPQFPTDGRGQPVRSFEWNESTRGALRPGAWPLDDLYAAYQDDPEGHLLIPHVGGRRCNLDWHHPELERLIEIGSAWGQFHWVYAEALARGYRLGASASSDEHQGRCGGGAPATAVFGSRGGLTGVLADRADRATVGQALRARRTFATTGEHSVATLRLGDRWMGEVVTAAAAEDALDYRLLGDRGWESLRLFDGDRIVWERDLHRELGLSDRRIRLRLGGARIRDRYRGAYWSGGVTITGAAVQRVDAFGFDHPEQGCWRRDATTVAIRTVTHGDTDSVELTLSQLAGARIRVHLEIGTYVKVGNPLTPPPNPHAPEAVLEIDGDALLDDSGPLAGRVTRTLPGTELEVTVERITEAPLPRDVAGRIPLAGLGLAAGREHPLFLTARQRDQSRVWTSALFLTP
ncbi:hypothetical protein [Azospirillum sp. TSO35-2]|uniref:hypothetical protein n=1 Tax=Azospirillum sp. TSO35-2 TaxID=716796 RepID=UPI000D61FE47|nr:hypothetical protein [Azospirillum sp. TSO35-2]PWC36022.1 hypothetical protein TSO352_12650 [Azospirillum sp. TSO35-2]